MMDRAEAEEARMSEIETKVREVLAAQPSLFLATAQSDEP